MPQRETACGSNRTIVGLKLVPSGLCCRSKQGSNRTIVGLKLPEGERLTERFSGQQSHHCGIETRRSITATTERQGSNRTIVGLKPRVIELIRLEPTLAAIAPLWD